MQRLLDSAGSLLLLHDKQEESAPLEQVRQSSWQSSQVRGFACVSYWLLGHVHLPEVKEGSFSLEQESQPVASPFEHVRQSEWQSRHVKGLAFV